MPREVDVECTECGFKEKVVEGVMGLMITRYGRFKRNNKTWQWPGIAMDKKVLTKEIYENQIKEWKKESKKGFPLKKLEHLESLWIKDGCETFKCPECGKDTLKWTVTLNYEI